MDALIQAIMEGRKPGSEFTLSPRRLGLSREAFHALALQWEADQGGDGFTLVYVHRTGDHQLIDLVTLKRNRETMRSPPATLA
jgi:hypothetical protein